MHELTNGSPAKAILLFSIPLFIGNIFQQIYNLSDTIIVGQSLGVEALAAVGSTSSLSFLIIGFAQGMTVGLSLLLAQHFGAKRYDEVKRSFATSLIISIAVSILLTIFSLALLDNILIAMNTPAAILNDSKTYISTIFLGMPFIVFFNLYQNSIRALGDSKTPLFFLALSCLLNVVLALFFIYVLDMGIFGAGFATLISYIVPVIQCYFFTKKKMPSIVVTRSDLKAVTKDLINDHLKMAIPMAFQMSIIAIGIIIVQTTLNTLGTEAVAAQAVAAKVDQFASQPLASFGVALATFTAQNYGAGKYIRIIEGVKQGLFMSIGFGIVAGIIIILLGKVIVLAFVDQSETEVIRLAQSYFFICESNFFLLATLYILRNTLQGLGYGLITTFAGVIELVVRFVVSITLVDSLGFIGVCLANPFAWLGSVAILVTSYLYAINKLRAKEVYIEYEEVVYSEKLTLA